jgi:transposase
MTKQTKYSPEVRERAVRMMLTHQNEHYSQLAAIHRRSTVRRIR